MPSCLTLSIISYGTRIKWSNPGNRVKPSPTPLCSSYWKGTFRSPSTKVTNFYLCSNMGICYKFYWFFLFSLWFFDRCQLSVGVLAAPETLANCLVLVESVSQWEFWNCLVDCGCWLGSLSMLWWYKHSLSFRILFSSLQKKCCFIYILFPFLCISHWPWKCRMVFLTV